MIRYDKICLLHYEKQACAKEVQLKWQSVIFAARA